MMEGRRRNFLCRLCCWLYNIAQCGLGLAAVVEIVWFAMALFLSNLEEVHPQFH